MVAAATEAAEKIVLERLVEAKKASKKSYSEIAEETSLTNVYVAQLLRRQAHLKPVTASALQAAVPGLTDDLIQEMMKPPFRSYELDQAWAEAVDRRAQQRKEKLENELNGYKAQNVDAILEGL